MVLEKYPDNNKTADALYMKGQTLVKMGRRTQGGQEFQELIKRFPSDLPVSLHPVEGNGPAVRGHGRATPARATTTKRKK